MLVLLHAVHSLLPGPPQYPARTLAPIDVVEAQLAAGDRREAGDV